MEILLAIGITLCAICIIIQQARNNSLHHVVSAWKDSYSRVVSERAEWESKYWAEHRNASEYAEALDRAEDGESLAPPSHNVPPLDVDAIMAGSDDPVWDIVIDCRAAGLMAQWLERHPEFKDMQPHRIYGEFATYVLQLPDHQQSVAGVKLAVTGNA